MGENGRGLEFGLYVSCVQGSPVSRFGTKILIGADRDPNEPRKVIYRTKDIVAIPIGEATRYAREYRRTIDEGELIEHTAEEWAAQREQRADVRDVREKATRVDVPAAVPAASGEG